MSIHFSCQAPKYSPFGSICERHTDDVVTLWGLWQTALKQPIYDKHSLTVLESKIRTNIAGMMSNPDDAWSYAVCTFNTLQASNIFTMAQIAFRSYKAARIRHVMDCTEDKPYLSQGLVSALAWLPRDIAHPWIKKFLKSKNLQHKAIALKVCRLRNELPNKHLSRFLKQKTYKNHQPLYSQSLRIVGELKIQAEKDRLYDALKRSDNTKFWGLYSLILLGEHSLAKQLSPYIFQESELQEKAIDLAFRVLPLRDAWELIYELREYPEFKRRTIQATSVLADPTAIPWILEQMTIPALARICGEAFYNITGIDIEANGLSVDSPPPYSGLQSNTRELESDEHLPWPDTQKIALYWQDSKHQHLTQAQRRFLGIKINEHQLKIVLNNYRQRQRRAAALELALLTKDFPLYNTRGLCTNER